MSRLQTNALRHLSASSDNITLDVSGCVLMPNQPVILVDGNNNVDTTYNNTLWKEGTTSGGNGFSQGGMSWNSGTGRLTVPVAGKYRVCFRPYLTNSASMTGNQRFQVRKNSSTVLTVAHLTGGSSMPGTVHAETIVQMAAYDYIDVLGDPTYIPRIWGGSYCTYLFAQLVG